MTEAEDISEGEADRKREEAPFKMQNDYSEKGEAGRSKEKDGAKGPTQDQLQEDAHKAESRPKEDDEVLLSD